MPSGTATMSPAEQLRSKLESGTAIIGIIGLGYVGLPLAHVLHGGGFQILGFDIDPRKIDDLAAGRYYL